MRSRQFLGLALLVVPALACSASDPFEVGITGVGDAGSEGGQDDAGSDSGDDGAVPPVHDDSPSPTNVTALALDAARTTLYVGATDGAASVDLDTGVVTPIAVSEAGLRSPAIAAIVVDGEGAVWFGHGYAFCENTGESLFCGLSRLDPQTGEWRVYSKDTGELFDDRVFALAIAPDGSLHAGTYSGALTRTPSGQWPAYFDYHDCNVPGTSCTPLWSYVVADIEFAPDGSTWYAIDWMPIGISPKPGGVARRSAQGETDTWNMAQGLPSNIAERLTLAGGTVWAASLAGLAYLEQGAEPWMVVTAPHERVNDVATSTDGTVWMATDTGARWAKSDGTWGTLRSADGLPDDQVNVLLAHGTKMCFGTRSGVACLDPALETWDYPFPG